MLLHTKFCPIFIIVTLIEAYGKQQGESRSLARPTLSRIVAGSRLDTQTKGKHTCRPKNKSRGGTATERQKAVSEVLWTLLCYFFFSLIPLLILHLSF